MRIRSQFAALAAVMLLASADALAYSVLIKNASSVRVDDILDSQIDFVSQQPGAQSSVNTRFADNGSVEGYARGAGAANGGSLAVAADTYSRGWVDIDNVNPDVQTNVNAEVTLTIDDIVFTGPGTTTTTVLNLDLSGWFDSAALSDSAGLFAKGSAGVSVSVNWGGGTTEFIGLQSQTVSHNTYPNPPVVSGGDNNDLVGVSFPATISTGPLNVSLNQAYTLRIYLAAFASTQLDGHGNGDASGSSDFGHTLSFPTAGPVFDLLPGYSVNSSSAEIVDNAWLGEPVSVALVPLPVSAWLLAPALGLLAGRRRSRADA